MTPDRGDHVVVGRSRVDVRTKDLLKRLQPGEIAVIDHADLDRVAAEKLIEADAGAIVNAAKSITGRYQNVGPLLIVAAGIPLIDEAGPDLLSAISEDDVVRVDGEQIFIGPRCVAKGVRRTLQSVEEDFESAQTVAGDELVRFAANTLEWLQREAHQLLKPPAIPPLRTRFNGRHALVVVRGYDYRSDLLSLRPYIREMRPVLVGVDGGADAFLELGLKPDVIIGDFDSVSDTALRQAADLVHHVHVDGRAPGREALEHSGLPYHEFVADGTSEDVAMLLAKEAGAELIVAVGTHTSLAEFLDKGRSGMSSTFLVRLLMGPLLVDAKGVSRLYQTRVRKRDMLLLVLSAVITMVVISGVSPTMRLFLRSIWELVRG